MHGGGNTIMYRLQFDENKRITYFHLHGQTPSEFQYTKPYISLLLCIVMPMLLNSWSHTFAYAIFSVNYYLIWKCDIFANSN